MPLKFQDNLGKVVISPDLIAKARTFIPIVAAPISPVEEPPSIEPWVTVYVCPDIRLDGSIIMHRVEQSGQNRRCTCQDSPNSPKCLHINCRKTK